MIKNCKAIISKLIVPPTNKAIESLVGIFFWDFQFSLHSHWSTISVRIVVIRRELLLLNRKQSSDSVWYLYGVSKKIRSLAGRAAIQVGRFHVNLMDAIMVMGIQINYIIIRSTGFNQGPSLNNLPFLGRPIYQNSPLRLLVPFYNQDAVNNGFCYIKINGGPIRLLTPRTALDMKELTFRHQGVEALPAKQRRIAEAYLCEKIPNMQTKTIMKKV